MWRVGGTWDTGNAGAGDSGDSDADSVVVNALGDSVVSTRGFDGGTCDIAGRVDGEVKDGTRDDDAGSPDDGRGNEGGLTRRSNPLRRSGMVSSTREGIVGQQQAHPKAAMAQHGPSVRAEEQTLKWLFGSIEFILLFILFLRVFLNNLCKLEVSLDGRRGRIFLLMLAVALPPARAQEYGQTGALFNRHIGLSSKYAPALWNVAIPGPNRLGKTFLAVARPSQRLLPNSAIPFLCMKRQLTLLSMGRGCCMGVEVLPPGNTTSAHIFTLNPLGQITGPYSWSYAWPPLFKLHQEMISLVTFIQRLCACLPLHRRPMQSQGPANGTLRRWLWILIALIAEVSQTWYGEPQRALGLISTGPGPKDGESLGNNETIGPAIDGTGGVSKNSESDGGGGVARQAECNERHTSSGGLRDAGGVAEDGSDPPQEDGGGDDRRGGGNGRGKQSARGRTGSTQRSKRPRSPSPHQELRVLRPRKRNSPQPAPMAGPVIYTVGALAPSLGQELEERVARFHLNILVIQLCKRISAAANLHLVAKTTAPQGWGYSARQLIPAGTDICYYSGTLEYDSPNLPRNHLIELPYHCPQRLVVDGTPSGGPPALGLMQIVNHSCEPHNNCKARYWDTDEGLGLWVLQTSRDIQPGEPVSFDYGGDFWTPGPRPRRRGYRLVTCACAGVSCPKGRSRWERPTSSRNSTRCGIGISTRAASSPARSESQHGLQAALRAGSKSPDGPNVSPALAPGSVMGTGELTQGTPETELLGEPEDGGAALTLALSGAPAIAEDLAAPCRSLSLTCTTTGLALTFVNKTTADLWRRASTRAHLGRGAPLGQEETALPARGGDAEETTAQLSPKSVAPSQEAIAEKEIEVPTASAHVTASESPSVGTAPVSGTAQWSAATIACTPGNERLGITRPPERPLEDVEMHQLDSSKDHNALLQIQPWRPGSRVHYRQPRGGPQRQAERGFPVWAIPGAHPLRAVFLAADLIQPTALYLAADKWNKTQLVKEFGAFESAMEFLPTLEASPIRCYYEVIRDGHPCKAYLDLEGDKGALTNAEGAKLLDTTLRRWTELIETEWPECLKTCPRVMDPVILDGSRQTPRGWKVSYHVIFPWLVFPRNDGSLKELASTLSACAELQYLSLSQELKPFVDDKVYTKNRLFRTVQSWKLDDPSCTAMRITGPATVERLLMSFITRIEPGSWLVPASGAPEGASTALPRPRHSERAKAPTSVRGGETAADLLGPARAKAERSIRQLLAENGHLSGQLSHRNGRSFRWQAIGPRHCKFAQQWRPSEPTHDSNGALVLLRENGEVCLCCLHPRCRDLGAREGQYLGMLFLEPDPATTAPEAAEYAGDPPATSARDQPGQHSPRVPLPVVPPEQTMNQCLRRVFRQNVLDDDGPFTPVEIGGSNSHRQQQSETARRATEPSLTEHFLDSINGPHAPPRPSVDLRKTLQALLSRRERGSGSGDGGSRWAKTGRSDNLDNTSATSERGRRNAMPAAADEWQSVPARYWFSMPIGCRPAVGHLLLQDALQKLVDRRVDMGRSRELPDQQELAWADEAVRIGAVNVGFKGLAASSESVVHLLLRERCDIMFLSDLRVARDKIGQLRRTVEAALLDEWRLHTDIPTTVGRPVGMGALIHASLAQHTRQLDLQRPPNILESDWNEAVRGRVLHLEVDRPFAPKTWWIVGIYQHVAKPANATRRGHLLQCLAAITNRAEREGHQLLIIGDANSAPAGGRWHCRQDSALLAFDQGMLEWAQAQHLTEVPQARRMPTWRACLKSTCATLDRAWYFPAPLGIAEARTRWAEVDGQLDHALIFVDLPPHHAGPGFAGACGLRQEHRRPRCKVDLVQLYARRDEWALAVRTGLRALRDSGPFSDPFVALAAASRVADRAAQSVAPRETASTPWNARQRPFTFRGHRAMKREVNWLVAARRLVKRVIDSDPSLLLAPERNLEWRLRVQQLHQLLRRSVAVSPPPITEPIAYYSRLDQRPWLEAWMESALTAVQVRHTLMRRAFEQAVDRNLRRLRGRMRANPNDLTPEMIQAALGKAPASHRIWGISGQVHVGVQLGIPREQVREILTFLGSLPSTEHVVRVVGSAEEVRLWFRGPRPLGDFLEQWSTSSNPSKPTLTLKLLTTQHTYTAVVPDDMLAMQELYLAREGMASSSQCPRCKEKGLQPIVTSAVHQDRGNPMRAIRFFCSACGGTHQRAEHGPEPPCPVPADVWQSMRKFPPDMPPFLSRPMDMDSVQSRLRKLPLGKATGRDGIPFEYFKYGPNDLLEYLLRAANAFLSGSHPLPADWLGGLVTLLPKTPDASTMRKFRPITNLSSAYKFCASEVTDRLMRTFETYGVWHDSQEGARRGRNTRRQVYKLAQILEEGRREKTTMVLLQLDFNSAFTSANQNAVHQTLSAYGTPQADIDLIRRMQAGSWYSVDNPFGESAACELCKGTKQGCPASPALYDTVEDSLLWMASASGYGWRHPRKRPMEGMASNPRGVCSASDPMAAYVDDTTIITQGQQALAEAQAMVLLIEVWEPWSGVSVHVEKSNSSGFDFATDRPVDTSGIQYRGQALPVLSPTEPFKFLGVLMTVTLDFRHEKDKVRQATRRRVDAVVDAKSLTPTQRELIVLLAVVPLFRYSAGLVPWSTSELEDLTGEWARGFRSAWGLPRGADTSLFRLSRGRGGRGCPSALGVWITEATSLITQCLRKPGTVAHLMIDDLRRSCEAYGCITLYQLQRMIRLVTPRSRTELLLSRLDQLGLDVMGTFWKSPARQSLLIAETIWPSMWRAKRERLAQGSCFVADSDRACLRAIGKLAASGIWYAAQLHLGKDHWLDHRDVKAHFLTSGDYQALLDRLRRSPFLDRIAQERAVLPGRRQLTLWEPVARNAHSAPTESAGPQALRTELLEPFPGFNSQALVTWPGTALHTRQQPWQFDPPLPNAVSFDLASDAPVLIPAPPGWDLLQRNGRLLVSDPAGSTRQLEAAQAITLERMNAGMSQEAFLTALMRSCDSQLQHDEVQPAHLSRHLLANLARVTKAKVLVGCRSVTYHAHYQWYSSPEPSDMALGSTQDWPHEICVCLLDAFRPERRADLLRKAFGHPALVWIVRLTVPCEALEHDSQILRAMKAQLYARIPKRAWTVHTRECWTEARYDACQSHHAVEIWRLGRDDASRAHVSPMDFTQSLGSWEIQREDFHWPADDHPVTWDYYREGQQDAAQDTWNGVVAAIDGSVDRRSETMGSGVTLGSSREPELSLAFAIGGPLSSLRAEAAALHGLLELAPGDKPLLVFTDCLVLLTILIRWGHVDYWPDPDDVKHFDIIEPCIQLLRQRVAVTRLVKVKSHSGLLLNERADSLAEMGRGNDEDQRWPGPRKLDPLTLRLRGHVRQALESFPDDNVPDKQLIRKAAESLEGLAARQRSTIFSREVLADPTNAGHILCSITHQPDSTVRLWMQSVSGLYPTAARLHQMLPALYPTAICHKCNMGVPETLSHFLTVCPGYREARTEAHNRSWASVMQVLVRAAPEGWQFFHDQPMANTGLILESSSADRADAQGLRLLHRRRLRPVDPGQSGPTTDLLNWRPDVVAISPCRKKIALLEYCRPYDGIDQERPSNATRPPSHPAPEAQGHEAHASEPEEETGHQGPAQHGRPPGSARAEGEDNRAAERGSGSHGQHAEGTTATSETINSRRRIRVAAERKRLKYQPLIDALQPNYGDLGWQVRVFPWVAGVRGIIDAAGIASALSFLEIPRQKWHGLQRRTAVSSVESLVFMHKVRRAGNAHSRFSQPSPVSPVPAAGRARKRKRTGEAAKGVMQRWKRLTKDPMRTSLYRLATE